MNIGALYVNLKQNKKALNYFERILKINNQNSIAKEMIRNLKRM
jgi:tetratricopeptide (TPR) repeat protein